MIDPGTGRAGFTARLVAGRLAARKLRPGQILTLRVAHSSLTGRTELRGHGVKLGVASGTPLPEGKTLQFRVLKLQPAITLKLLSASSPAEAGGPAGAQQPAALQSLLARLGLPDGMPQQALAEVLLQSRRALDPALIRSLSAHLRGDSPARMRREARASVERADRGMDPEARPGAGTGGEELAALLLDRWPQRDGHNPGPDSDDGDDPGSSAKSIEAYLRRATAAPDHPLQLFNALRGSGNLHWILVPLGAQQGSARVQGSLKLGLDPVTLRPVAAQLSVQRPAGLWRLWWDQAKAGGSSMVLSAWTSEDPADPVPEALLARIGRTGHTGVVEPEQGDGFVSEMNSTGTIGFEGYG